MCLIDDIAGRAEQRLLDHVAQLANVARPTMVPNAINGASREANLRPPIAATMQRQKVAGEKLSIAMPATKRRHVDGDNAQPEIEIGPELAGTHQFLQRPIGRGDKPHVDFSVTHSANTADGAVLKQFQELLLNRLLDIANFVEKQRAAMRRLDQTNLAIFRICESPSLMAEQLRFKELHWQRRAIDFDEWGGLSWPTKMQGTGDQFFAGAGLAANEHSRRFARDQIPFRLDQYPNTFAQPLHWGRVADKLIEAAAISFARIEVRQCALQLLLAERLVDEDFELAENDRLHKVVVGACLHRIDRSLHAAVSGDADNFDPRVTNPNLLHHLEPMPVRQIQVQQDNVEFGLIEKLDPLGGRARSQDLIAASLEITLDVLGEDFLVLDQEDTAGHLLKLLQAIQGSLR